MVTGIRVEHEHDRPPDIEEGRRWLPLLVVVATVVLCLWTYRAQASPPIDLNDSGLHLSTTEWAAERLRDGHNPFDGWYPYLGLGFPQTHHYQSLPHVVTAVIGLAVGVENAYHWSLYLLLAGWPLAVYAGARLLSLSRWTGAFAAVLAPWLVSASGYGYEAGSYTWQGLGIWPQLWAAWLLPVAIGLGWRAVRREASPALAGGAVAACALCHLLTGWLALAVIALLPLLEWRDLARRFGRLGILLATSAASVAWFVVPLFLDRSGADYTGYERGTFWYDSYGATRVLKWLGTGDLFDRGRLPIVTVLAAVGLVVTILRARRHAASRLVLLLTGLSLVLFFGRPTLGPVLDVLPFGDDLFYPRFVVGVHLGGLLLAGVGAAWLANVAVGALTRLSTYTAAGIAAAIVSVAVVSPVIADGIRTEDEGRGFIADQREADEGSLADALTLIDSVRDGDGRVFAGAQFGWGNEYRIGFVPAYALLLHEAVDAVGFQLRVSSLATAAEERLDDTSSVQLDLFGVRWMMLPAGREPAVPSEVVAERGAHTLWRLTDAAGYADVVDSTGPVTATGDTLGAVVAAGLLNGDIDVGRRLLIEWDGRSGEPTAVTERAGRPGTIAVSAVAPAEGAFTFRAEADRPAYVALAASWHPRWQARVDGERAEVVMMAPGVAAVRVDEGSHAVVFQYVPFRWTWVILAVGVLFVLALSVAPRWLLREPVASKEPPELGRQRRNA